MTPSSSKNNNKSQDSPPLIICAIQKFFEQFVFRLKNFPLKIQQLIPGGGEVVDAQSKALFCTPSSEGLNPVGDINISLL
jgi:hypothetical protein